MMSRGPYTTPQVLRTPHDTMKGTIKFSVSLEPWARVRPDGLFQPKPRSFSTLQAATDRAHPKIKEAAVPCSSSPSRLNWTLFLRLTCAAQP